MCLLHLTCSTPCQQVNEVATGKKAHGDSTLAVFYKEVSDYHLSTVKTEVQCTSQYHSCPIQHTFAGADTWSCAPGRRHRRVGDPPPVQGKKALHPYT